MIEFGQARRWAFVQDAVKGLETKLVWDCVCVQGYIELLTKGESDIKWLSDLLIQFSLKARLGPEKFTNTITFLELSCYGAISTQIRQVFFAKSTLL